MRGLWADLVTENPMLIEIQRVRRRFFMVGTNQSHAGIVLGLATLCYLGLLMLVLNFLGDFPPMVLLFLHLGIFTLIAPSQLYAAIAGEREKRTWDLLVVAPLTKAQIVVGKFIGALAALGAGSLLFLLPIFLTAATYRGTDASLSQVIVGEFVILSFLIMECAFVLFVSARVERPFTALATVIGSLAVLLMVLPLLLNVMLPFGSGDSFQFFHPFMVLTKIADINGFLNGRHQVSYLMYGWPQIAAYLVCTGVFLVWTINTLRYVDGEHGPVSKVRNHA